MNLRAASALFCAVLSVGLLRAAEDNASVMDAPVSADSTVQTRTPLKPAGGNDIGFNPDDFLFQPRFLDKGEGYSNRFLDHLYVGFMAGMEKMSPKGSRHMKTAMPVGGMVGYDFSKLHGARLTFEHINGEMKDDFGSIKQWGVGLDYVFNLTNYLCGYNKRRVFHVSPTIGVGYLTSTYHGERESVLKGQVGLSVGLGLGRNARVLVEPYVSVLTDEADHSGDANLSKFDVKYGVKAGFTINLDNTNDYYGSDVVYTRGFFYEVAQGAVFYKSDDLAFGKTIGTGYKVSVGRWFDPVVGVRATAQGSEYYWSHQATLGSELRPSYDTYYKGSMFSGRLEGLVNPLNFIPYWRRVRHHFELNLAIGGEYGWLTKYYPLTENGLKCNYVAFTAAVSCLYNLDKETSFFIEPRYTMATFREPYVNVDREAQYSESVLGLYAGVRICALSRKERKLWPDYTFEKRLFAGVTVGSFKHMHSTKLASSYSPNYAAGYYMGWHWGRYASVKGVLEFASLSQNELTSYSVQFMDVTKEFSAAWHNRFNYFNLKLLYMLNLANVYQRYDLGRRFNLYIEAGAAYSRCRKVQSELYAGELQVGYNAQPMAAGRKGDWAPMAVLGIVGQYRFTDRWSLIVEPEVNYCLKKNYIGGEVLSPFNDVLLRLNIGTSFTF